MKLVRVVGMSEMSYRLAMREGPCFFWRDPEPGDAPEVDRRFYFTVPSPFTQSGLEPFWAKVHHGPQTGGIHGWDGNEDEPTLTPSLLCTVGDHELWHGYIRSGRIEP